MSDPIVMYLGAALLFGLGLLVWAIGQLKAMKTARSPDMEKETDLLMGQNRDEFLGNPASDANDLRKKIDLDAPSSLLSDDFPKIGLKEEEPVAALPKPPSSPPPPPPPKPVAAPVAAPPVTGPKIVGADTGIRPEGQAQGPAPTLSKDVVERLDSMTQRLSEMQSVLLRQSSPSVGSAPSASLGQGFTPETIDRLLKIIGNVTQQVDVLQRSLGGAKPAVPTPPAPARPVTPPAAGGADTPAGKS